MCAVTMWLVLALSVVSSSAQALAGGYCAQHTFPVNATYMRFTKEPVPYEYGFVDKFKSIHCCVKGYRSIEWFKDGVAYPWSAGVSNLILYPEAANQTLYTRRAARSDGGNYTCRITNDTHSETHTVVVEILEKPADAPKTMFISKDQWVEEAKPLRLFCEALIGHSYLADARSDLRWYKVWPNASEGELLPTQTQIRTTREDVDDIFGAYLIVEQMSAQDYGTYACVVHSNDIVSKNYVTIHHKNGGASISQGPWGSSGGLPWRSLLLGASALVALLLTAAAVHARCTPRLLLAARHARDRARTPAHRARVLEKEFDVVVSWTRVDGELVRGALLPTLALKYKYRALSVPLPTAPDTWYSVLSGEVSRARSLVAVVSPAQYSAPQLLTALRQLRALPLPPVVVLLQDLPDLKRCAKDSGESLVAVLRRTRLVPWRHVHERDFWTQLRLALPLPPPIAHRHIATAKPTVEETEESKNSRSGSMTALV